MFKVSNIDSQTNNINIHINDQDIVPMSFLLTLSKMIWISSCKFQLWTQSCLLRSLILPQSFKQLYLCICHLNELDCHAG